MDIDFSVVPAKLPKDALVAECEHWRQTFSQLDDVVRYYLMHTGEMCRVVTRNYRGYLGVFYAAHWSLEEVELGVETQEYEAGKGQHFREIKLLRMPRSSITQFEFISEREAVIIEEETDEESRAREVSDILT